MDFLPVRRAITFSRPDERAAADEQDVGGVHRGEFLVRVLASALRRNIGDRAFQNLQQRLLHAFARNIARDGGILVLAADLVDLVDIDDALLALLHVAVGRLQQLEDDVLDILAHVAGFGQGGGIHDGERHVQNLAPGSAPCSVLPVPVGPISRMLDFCSSTSVLRIRFMWMRLQWL